MKNYEEDKKTSDSGYRMNRTTGGLYSTRLTEQNNYTSTGGEELQE